MGPGDLDRILFLPQLRELIPISRSQIRRLEYAGHFLVDSDWTASHRLAQV